MTIEKNIIGTSATFTICGRLDTATAPALEAAVDGCIGQIRELILDCGTLEYISSAGLRVLLKTQKILSGRGSLKLIHVNDMIMEVFDITGFADILTIA